MAELGLWKRCLLAAMKSLQPLAAFAAIVGIPVYLLEAPERAETRNLIKAQLVLQCIQLLEEVNGAFMLESELGRPLRPDQVVDPDREKFLEELREQRREYSWELDQIYRDSCQGLPNLRPRI